MIHFYEILSNGKHNFLREENLSHEKFDSIGKIVMMNVKLGLEGHCGIVQILGK